MSGLCCGLHITIMRIAQIAPLAEAVPPKRYGGTERVVSYLTEELVRQGHDVTLFASGDSRTNARLVPCCPKALRLDESVNDPVPYTLMMLDRVRSCADEFDVLHFHIELEHFPLFQDIARTVTTLHGRLDANELSPFYDRFSQFPLVSISDDQRRPMPPVNWAGTVYHGLPLELLPFSPSADGGYLAFLGRIAPGKRPDRAIEIAKRSGIPLRIAAKIADQDRKYFEEHIRPLFDDPLIQFVDEIGESAKGEFLGETPVLLGVGIGDDSTPGVGAKDLADIGPAERTTPAGRFVAKFGMAFGRQRVLWVDYANSVALHAVITTHKKEQRVERLLSPSPDDNRISFGCINVGTSFYIKQVRPLFLKKGGVVYILPDTKPLETVFPRVRLLPYLAASAAQ